MKPYQTVSPARLVRCGAAMVCLAALLAPFVSTAQAQSRVLAEIDNIYAEEVRTAGFVLDRSQDVSVEVVAPGRRRTGQLLGNAWILDARTRTMVWSMADAARHERGGDVLELEENLRLPAGPYEVYYASYVLWDGRDNDRWDDADNLGDLIRNVLDEIFDDKHDWRNWEETYRREARNSGITVRGSSGHSESNLERLADPFLASAFLTLTSPSDDFYVNQGFVVKRPMDLEVYAIGEMDWNEEYDYGWIINTDTRERVWVMDHDNTEPAGGADKNRVARARIHLREGSYAAFFATDDSHSAEEWNAFPPYDPDFWGLTLRVHDPADLRYVALEDYRHASADDAVVALRGLRDDADEEQGFRLTRPMDVRIYALGEGTGGRMYDYGWILDADTHERVWVMDYDDTEHAGGADKNRLFDGVIHLPAGNYIVHFETDGSHAYGDFNSAAPFDAEAWGITIFPGSDGAEARSIASFDEANDAATLAQIVRVRDDQHRRASFKLDRDSRVRIYALGEGSGGEMYDYGWIENARGGVVWEMTYRMTDHAGGADKNRMLNKVILLPAGEYTVHYQTDDSHAYGDWNSRAPHDSSHWGITIRRVED